MKQLLLLCFLYLFGFSIYAQKNISPNYDSLLNAAHQQTRRTLADELLYRIKKEKPDRTTTFRLAEYANKIDPNNNEIMQVLLDCAYGDTSSWHRTIAGHAHWVFAIAFTPDGSKIISSGADDKLKVWDANTLKELNSFHIGETAWAIDFSKDGTKFALGLSDSTVTVYDGFNYQELFKLKGHKDHINSVAFSPDGSRIVSGGEDGFVKIWDVSAQTLLSSFKEIRFGIESVAFSPDGKKTVAGGHTNFLRILDAKTCNLLASIEIDTTDSRSIFQGTDAVAFSPDGSKILASAYEKEGCIKSWDAATFELSSTFNAHKYSPDFLFYSSDGTKLISGSEDKTIKFWDAETHKLLREIENIPDQFLSIAISPNGNKIACDVGRNFIQIFDLKNRKNLSTVANFYNERIKAFSHNGEKILTSFNGGTRLTVWDTQTNDSIFSLHLHPFEDRMLDVSPKFKKLLTGNKKGSFNLWNLSNGVLIKKLETNSEDILSAKFSENTQKIITCHRSGKISKWDIDTGSMLNSVKIDSIGHFRQVYLTKNNSRAIVYYQRNKSIKIFDVNKNKKIFSLENVDHYKLSPSGDKLIARLHNNSLQMWNIKTNQLLYNFEGKTSNYSFTFSPDYSKILSQKQVWDANNGNILFSIPYPKFSRAWGIRYSENKSDQILIYDTYTLSHFWLNPDSLINDVIKKYNPSHLRPFEIEKYELEKSFAFTGFTNKELIEQRDEHWLFYVADYYFEKAEQLNRNKKLAKPYFEKAIELYEALEKIADHYKKETYTDRKNKTIEWLQK